jgi:hypothetical protein
MRSCKTTSSCTKHWAEAGSRSVRFKFSMRTLPPLNREERAARAKVVISTHFNNKQQLFWTSCLLTTSTSACHNRRLTALSPHLLQYCETIHPG